jgi:hypothetical protein
LQGAWTNTTTTPLERPDAFEGKPVLTPKEQAEWDTKRIQDDKDHCDPQNGCTTEGAVVAYNEFWMEKGKTSQYRTSLIVDPADGKVPPLTAAGQKRMEALAATRRAHPADSAAHLSAFTRCITRSLPGAMMPGFYSHNYRIVQTPEYVAIVVEMIHDTRIIPLDGRPHLNGNLRQWLGDSRGRWDGNTLVVDTTNFNDKVFERSTTNFGLGERLHLIERFTRIDADTIDYRYTIDAPTVYSRPWTVAVPMVKLDGDVFEFACHEGNYGLSHILSGTRAEERDTAEDKKGEGK